MQSYDLGPEKAGADLEETRRQLALANSELTRISAAQERALIIDFIRHRPETRTALPGAIVHEVPSIDDDLLVRRVQAGYRTACATPVGDQASFWLREFAAVKEAAHKALLGVGSASAMLRNPAHGMLLYGFDGLHAHMRPEHADYEASWAYDNLIRLAEALGVVSLEFPEVPFSGMHHEIEHLLELIDSALGFRVDFPNPYPSEIGLPTSRGVCSYRCPQAIFQAWRIAELLPDHASASVVEIGPGLGRTAYYAYRLGIHRYTLIDIPLSSAAQAYFLGRLLGDDAIQLVGERAGPRVIIASPTALLTGSDDYDLVVNVDSLTEMSRSTAEGYWQFARERRLPFLSINHEHNAFRFRDIYTDTGDARKVQRSPYWMRRGYVEELARFR